MKTCAQPMLDLVYTQAFIPVSTTVRMVVDLFKQEQSSFLAVTEENAIIGLVGREKLNLKVASQYGWALYAGKPISALMDRTPLLVDGATNATDVLREAVARSEDAIYDDVIVSNDGVFAGLVSVKTLLLSQIQTLEEQLRKESAQRTLLERTISAHLLDRRSDEGTMARKADAIVDAAQEIELAEGNSAAKEANSMTGYLGDFSPIDLAQLLIQGGKTGCLELRAGDNDSAQGFEIHLLKGRIVHATGAGDHGAEALWKALRLQSGAFAFHFHRKAHEITIEADPMGLLLEACRRQDEAAA